MAPLAEGELFNHAYTFCSRVTGNKGVNRSENTPPGDGAKTKRFSGYRQSGPLIKTCLRAFWSVGFRQNVRILGGHDQTLDLAPGSLFSRSPAKHRNDSGSIQRR